MDKKKWARERNEFGLTERQERFAQEYLVDLSSTKAANRVGYTGRTAENVGRNLAKNPLVKKRIEDLCKVRAEKTALTAEYVISGLMRIAGVTIKDLHNQDGKLLSVHELSDETAHAVQSIDNYKDFTEGVEIGETQKIKLHDKMKAFELLGRHLKMFTDKVEHSGQIGLADKLEKARKRK